MEKGDAFFNWKHKTIKGKKFDAKVLLTRFKKDGRYVLQATVRDIKEEIELIKKLKDTAAELEKFNKFAVDRELKMIELKKKIRELE